MSHLQASLLIILISALPISELRGAIPLALTRYGMVPLEAYLLAVMGNIIPVIFILLYLERAAELLRKVPLFDRFLSWLFARTRRKHGPKFNRFGAFALVLLVAIPLPATGAWTGSLAAFLFGVKFRYAFPLIVLGVLIAGVIVTLMGCLMSCVSALRWHL